MLIAVTISSILMLLLAGIFVIQLRNGRDCQWVRNVVSAGSYQLETRGVLYQFSAPTIVRDYPRRRFTRARNSDNGCL